MRALEWTAPHGFSIRAAGQGEIAEFKRLVKAMNVPFEPTEAEIEDGSTGAFLRAAFLDGKRMAVLEAASRVLVDSDSYRSFYAGVSLALVAVDSSSRVVGLLQAIPPGQVINGLLESGWPLQDSIPLGIKVAKVSALWVDEEARRAGLGSALLDSCCDVYFAAGFSLVYGNFRLSSPIDLESFYGATGFRILPPGDRIPVGTGQGRIVDIGTEPDQKIFYMTRGNWAKLDRSKPKLDEPI
ncbi:GNAT family N-acetyltransferase [Arthrobacter sp. H35-D1]|uniref:GNAT family N-acetyltransferase n=1 Tax=Arthrobacter sp. H35-D1 TaxID=3046202 RepID=UPI0024BA6DF6|nr:GNAT family N-acetyltransferase [Arthrobacter sp. H35-D1]MDJ0313899.1 GNAT family N-acetyltransferase [Arthrobacter sp. H35-D1]